MKTAGIILLVLGIMSFIGGIIGVSSGQADGSVLSGPIIFIIIGAFLISRANKKKEEEERKSDGNKGKRLNEIPRVVGNQNAKILIMQLCY